MGQRINRVIFQLHKIGFKPALLFQFESREDLVLRNVPETLKLHNQILLYLQSFRITGKDRPIHKPASSYFLYF